MVYDCQRIVYTLFKENEQKASIATFYWDLIVHLMIIIYPKRFSK